MLAQELRIGNYIYDTKGDVNTVDLTALKYLLDYKDIHQAKPILITEEWLLKLEFEGAIDLSSIIKEERTERPFFYGDCVASIHKDFEGVLFRYTMDESIEGSMNLFDSLPLAQIKYIHELQNLYFALTGDELTINNQNQ